MAGADLIQILSVLIEMIIATGAVFIAVRKQQRYGWAIAVTFGLYVIFDLFRMGVIPSLAGAEGYLFLTANCAMLIGVWLIIREK